MKSSFHTAVISIYCSSEAKTEEEEKNKQTEEVKDKLTLTTPFFSTSHQHHLITNIHILINIFFDILDYFMS